jgi:formamidopyrimidine-DNA glycosylase
VPELPELEVVSEVLNRRVAGQTVTAVELIQPGGGIVTRDLTFTHFGQALTNKKIEKIQRRGKFLIFSLQHTDAVSETASNLYLAVNLKLTGRLQLAQPNEKLKSHTCLILSLSEGGHLRYLDQKTMGQIYLTRDLAKIHEYATLGPEPFDISAPDFAERLKPYRGEIKTILTHSEFIGGIGNAYVDEILWAAKIHPYRKRTQLTSADIERLYQAMQSTLREAIEKVQAGIGEDIHLEKRDFMAVHMKTDQPCPRCGTRISLVKANQRITNYCQTCQPGGLIKGM